MSGDTKPRTEKATDQNCRGYCLCPTCGGPAHWSFTQLMHGCADPGCATLFREHNDEQNRLNVDDEN